MKLFECENCGQVLFFENSICTGCNEALGYSVETRRLVVLSKDSADGATVLTSGGTSGRYVMCRNYSEHDACNWLVLAPPPDEQLDQEPPDGEQPLDTAPSETPPPYCRSCQLTEVIPDLSQPSNKQAWIDVERAKRRLLYTLYALELQVTSKHQDADRGLAFKFLQSTPEQQVMTGHSSGIVTLNVAEADAAFRENMREKLGEAYRTVLGHLRHEIGHYYWDRLIQDGPSVTEFRTLFGDERQDYEEAIARHYDQGPPSDWSDSFISAYASMHPWEDWAETWAHYLHMVDTLETAKSHGMIVRVPGNRLPGNRAVRVATDKLALRDFEGLLSSWHAVTLTLNSLSRSMGVKDVYPFVLSPRVREKLRFVHRIIMDRPLTAAAETKLRSAASRARKATG